MANDHSHDDSLLLISSSLSAEALECLTCSICLELVYKPVVTACGHMFCFWCSHEGMNPFMASSCPLCRRPYIYFPQICRLLHFMLSKAVPDEYSKRGAETRRSEEKVKIFSPELGPMDCRALLESKDGDASTVSKVDTMIGDSDYHSALEPSSSDSTVSQGTKTRQDVLTVNDFSCALCNCLLYRPVVLNCGDVFCQPCLKDHASEVLHCPSCGALHPAGSVLVCMELHKFLQTVFSSEYAKREQKHTADNGTSANCDAAADSKLEQYPGVGYHASKGEQSMVEQYPHVGVGCDGCGMYPILGDRYKCEDCEEKAGFDLCGSCYNNSGSCIGRFNQKHKPSHRMRQIERAWISIHFADDFVDSSEEDATADFVEPSEGDVA